MKTLFSSSRTARCLSAAAVALALGACGGGGGGGSTGGTPGTPGTPGGGSSLKTGLFIDAAVSGLPYETTSGQKGKTGADGAFQYKEGDRVSFTLGDMPLGSAKAAPKVFVWDLERAGEANDPTRTARERLVAALLLSMDKDGNSANGIQLHAEIDQAKGLPDLATVRQDSFVPSLKTFVGAVADWIAANGSYVGSKTGHWNKSKILDAENAGSDHIAQTAQEHYTPVPEPAGGLGGGLNCQGLFAGSVPIPVQGAALTPEAALAAFKGQFLHMLLGGGSGESMCHSHWPTIENNSLAYVTNTGELRAGHPEYTNTDWLSAQQVTKALSDEGATSTCRVNEKDSSDEWMTAACKIKAKLYPSSPGRYVWISDETITAEGKHKGQTHRWSFSVAPTDLGVK